MATTIIRPATREEWLEVRKGGIGSSEVATIVGLNPWETPYQLWRRKLGMDEPKQETFAMKAGHYLEDAVSQFWQDETGREVIKRSAGDWIIQDAEKTFLQVSPDRTFWLAGKTKSNDNKGILECKTTQMSIDPDDIPKHWFCQLQYQLGVAGLTEGSLAWLSSGREFGYKDIQLVPDFYAWLEEEVTKFWTDNVLGGVEPSAVSVKDVLLKYNTSVGGKTKEVTDELFNAYQDLKQVKAELAQMEERKEELETKLKAAFEDAEAITYGGDIIATWKTSKPSEKLDSKALKAAHPELVKEFTVQTAGTRRFLLK